MPPKNRKKNRSKATANKGEEATDKYAYLSQTERLQKATEAKDRGNKYFTSSSFTQAVEAFTEAIELDGSNHVFYSNRSAAYLSLGNHEQAVADAEQCIKISPQWSKGYSRLASAYHYAEDFKKAVDAYVKGIQLDPTNSQLTTGLAAAQAALGRTTGKATSSNNEDGLEDSVRQMSISASNGEAAHAQTAVPPPPPSNAVAPVIGIDLGTTYSCVAAWKDNGVEIIANSEGKRTTPSWVGFTDSERLIGEAAKQQAAANAVNTVFDVKRIIGRSFSDPVVQADVAQFPFKVVKGEEDKVLIEVQFRGKTRTFSPEEISAMVLQRMKETAEAFLGTTVKAAVITVPAYFNDQQRQATKNAGAIAGLDVKRIINEPTAAALSYGLDKSSVSTKGHSSNVLIFDLGGGTFDVSVLSITEGIFEVKSTGGDTHLGGEDFDTAIVDFVVSEFKRKNKGLDPTKNPRALRRMRAAAESAKRMLSTSTVASIEVDSLVDGIDLNLSLTRAKFEQINNGHFSRCLETVQAVLTDAKMSTGDISDVVLVGGSTRIPKIQEMLSEFFGGKELCRSINPDEAVAYGAAVQGAILSGIKNDSTTALLLVDVTPLSLGIETTGRMMSTLIKRNTTIPVRKTKVYTTEEDYQTAVDVVVYEGERACVDSNNKLGEFTISGIQRAKRGEPQVEVTFDIDANGILHVSAKDKITGAQASTTITNNSGRLSQDEIDRMIEESNKFKNEDEQFVARMDAKNELESLLYHVLAAAKESNNIEKLESLSTVRDWLEDNGENATTEQFKTKLTHVESLLRR